jgi:uncharacterized protein YndB with AHSA1/START domain
MTDRVTVSTEIKASPKAVWAALTDPQLVKTYMFGAMLKTDWTVGHKVTWSGDYQGKPYEDKGEIKTVEPEKRLVITHWSPMSKLPDEPAHYHTLTYVLTPSGEGTKLSLTQENLTGATPEQAEGPWRGVLAGLKKAAEGVGRSSH